MLVKVKRVKTDGWLGIKKYPNSFPDKIPVGIDARTGDRKRILTDVEEAQFEKDLGMEKGTLARSSPYWIDFYVPLEVDNVFDTNEPLHALYLKVLETKKMVAKSMEELKTNSYAEYVIYNEVSEAKESNISKKSKRQAYALLDRMSQADMVKTLLAYGRKPYDMDPEVIENTLNDLVEAGADRFVAIVTDPNKEHKIFLNELVHYGILITRSKQYIYDQTNLGEADRAVEHIIAKENSDLYTSLQRQLQEAKKKNI
jgi:hypothetical protein